MILTASQHERLDTLSGTVVGSENNCPVVCSDNGKLIRISPEGRVLEVSKQTREAISRRLLDRWERDS